MANPKEELKKQENPSVEELKKPVVPPYENSKKQEQPAVQESASKEELQKQVEELEKHFEELKKHVNAPFEVPKKQVTAAHPENSPYSEQLNTLKAKLNLVAANPDSDPGVIMHYINAITFFENQQIKKMAELRQETNRSPAFFTDNQSILQSSSVRKKEKEALEKTDPAYVKQG